MPAILVGFIKIPANQCHNIVKNMLLEYDFFIKINFDWFFVLFVELAVVMVGKLNDRLNNL